MVIDRVTVRPDARARIAGSVENALALGRGVLTVAYPRDDLPEPAGAGASTASTLPASDAGGVSSRSRRTISPSTVRLGWCPACEGLGVQTGTNPAACCAIPKLTLAEGAVALWPAPGRADVRARCWRAFRARPACRWTCPSSSLAASIARW